ncbi:MAG: hypothetical protein WCG55_02990 [bacterium]
MKSNIFWYQYPLAEDEKNTLRKSEVGREVLRLYELCVQGRKTVKRVRYVCSIIVAVIIFLGAKTETSLLPAVSISVVVSLVFFAWSWFILTEERNRDIKETEDVIAKLCEEQGGTQIGGILQRMIDNGRVL